MGALGWVGSVWVGALGWVGGWERGVCVGGSSRVGRRVVGWVGGWVGLVTRRVVRRWVGGWWVGALGWVGGWWVVGGRSLSTLHVFVGDTKTNQEFIATNPNKQVPSIDDNGFTLFDR